MSSNDSQPIPPFEQPENPLAPLPVENPYRRTRPRIKTPQQQHSPERVGSLLPEVLIAMRRRHLDRLAAGTQAAIAEDIERTAGQ